MIKKTVLIVLLLVSALLTDGCLTNGINGTWSGGCESSDGTTAEHIMLKLHKRIDGQIEGTAVDEHGNTAKVVGNITEKGTVELLIVGADNSHTKFIGIRTDDEMSGIWKVGDKSGAWVVKRK